MSSVRLCDRCGNVFSELEDGWQTFQATTVKKDERGKSFTETVQMDACPRCNLAPMRPAAQLAPAKDVAQP